MQISHKVLQKSYSKNIQLLQIFAENKQSDDALKFLTTSCLNKHNFEFKHRQLLGAAELFEMEPCLKRNRLFSLETVCAVHILLNMRNLNNKYSSIVMQHCSGEDQPLKT